MQIKSWLAAIVTVGFFAALFILFQVPLPESSKDILLVLIGCLTGVVKDVFSYYFGSSEGSARKTELMAPPVPEEKPPLNQAGFARVPVLCVLLALGLLAACATLKNDPPEVLAGKSLLAMKETIITAAIAGDELCKSRIVAPAVCMALADCYKRAQPAYDLAADSLRLVLVSKDGTAWSDYTRRQAAFREIFDDVLLISSQYNLLGGAK